MITEETQRENEERFDRLQSGLTDLKLLIILIEKLLEQNAKRNRQVDATLTTPSYDTHSSNTKNQLKHTLNVFVPPKVSTGICGTLLSKLDAIILKIGENEVLSSFLLYLPHTIKNFDSVPR